MFSTAHELCRTHEIDLSPDAVARLDWTASPSAFVQLLLGEVKLADARRVLAQALPRSHTLAWGCSCVRAAFPDATPRFEAAVRAVERYLAEPSDAHRRATEARANEVGIDTAAGCLAMAAFFCDGSLLPAELPVVAPRPFITGRLVSVAVYLAAVHRDPAQYAQHLRGYLDDGLARLEALTSHSARMGDVA
jgi:hypothetical protein